MLEVTYQVQRQDYIVAHSLLQQWQMSRIRNPWLSFLYLVFVMLLAVALVLSVRLMQQEEHQLGPVLVCLGLAAIASSLLLVSFQRRLQQRAIKDFKGDDDYRLSLNAQGLEVYSTQSSWNCQWAGLTAVVITAECILWVSEYTWAFTPLSCLDGQHNPTLDQLTRSLLEVKAPLDNNGSGSRDRAGGKP